MTFSHRLSKGILAHPKKLIFLLLLLVAFLASGIPSLRFSSDNRAFFGGDNQEFVDLNTLSDLYAGSSGFLLMIVPPEGEMFTPKTLTILRAMTEDTWQVPYALRVDSVVNFVDSRSEGDDIIVEPLLDEFEDITDAAAAKFRKVATASVELRNRLISEDGNAYGISLQVVLPDDFNTGRNEVSGFLFKMRDRWMAENPGFDVRLTGGVLGGLTLAMAAKQDILTLVPLAFLAVIALLVIFLRSAAAVISSTVVVVIGTIATFGFAGLLGIELTAGTAISPLSVMVLTAASCIHLILHWIRALDQKDPPEALRQALSENLGPILVTTVTTAIGFLGLNFAQSPPLQEMGNIVAFGLVIGMFATFTILPFGLSLSDKASGGRLLISAAMMKRFAQFVMRSRKVWLVIFPVAILASVAGISRIGYDDSTIRYFDQRFQFRQDADAIQAKLTGLDSLQFSFKAPEDTGIFDPDFLRDIEEFSGWLQEQDTVVAVSSITDIIKRLNKSMNGDDPAFSAIADSQQANAQLMMFYEMSLPVGLDLNSSIDVDRSQTRVTALQRTEHSQQIRDLAEASEEWLRVNTPNTQARAAGISIAFARVSERNNSQMLAGMVLVLVMVSLILIGTMRSIKMGLVSLAPNLLPAMLAFGVWGITFRDVNLGSTVVTTMTFGIVVDDTVHFLMHYLQGRKQGLLPREALEKTFEVVGSAIVITSLALAVGFAIMGTSGFLINQHLGVLTAIVIGFALLADLLFLPAILLSLDRVKK